MTDSWVEKVEQMRVAATVGEYRATLCTIGTLGHDDGRVVAQMFDGKWDATADYFQGRTDARWIALWSSPERARLVLDVIEAAREIANVATTNDLELWAQEIQTRWYVLDAAMTEATDGI